jgi:hypothetical protein
METPKFPKDFHDFRNGVTISDVEIQQWIDECIGHMESDKTLNSYSVASGNTSVDVSKCYYTESETSYYYSVIVAKGYFYARTF